MREHHRNVIASMYLLAVAGWLAPAAAQEDAAPAPEIEAHHTSLEEATAIAARLLLQQEDPVAAAVLQVREARAIVEALAPARRESGSGEIDEEYDGALSHYAESVLALGRIPRPEVLDPLRVAVRHEDDRVRFAAVVALREGAASDSHDPILQVVRDLITGDPRPEIRREAFETYCRWGDQDDVLVLAQALGRQGGPVQDLAVREWIRIEQEQLQASDAELQVERAREAGQ